MVNLAAGPTSVNRPRLVLLLITAARAELPLSVMLPLASGLLAVGRTRTFCQASEQATPLLLAVFSLNFICVVEMVAIASTVPLPAPAPMFNVVVPSNEPEPVVRPSETFKLAGNPIVEVLPNESCDLTTGCVASGEAVRERPPGGVLITNWTAAAGFTTTLP